MPLKGNLKSPDNVYFLSPKITTVGRENCDLVIQNPTVDDQHAIIEYSEAEEMFILRDLDTNNGTYVNECRIQNASVRLGNGDIIRFGFHGAPFEFSLENLNQQVIYPPVTHQRPTWQGSHTLRLLNEPTSAGGGPGGVPLPSVYSSKVPISQTQGQPSGAVFSAWTNVPHPPAAARPTRPTSGGRRQGPQQSRGGWISGQPRSANYSPGRESPVSEVLLPEKGDEKDGMIEGLRLQVASLQAQMTTLAADTNVRTKLLQLEAEVAAKKAEVSQLRDRLQQNQNGGGGGGLADSLELTSVRSDLERLRKDKQITSGLVAQLQKDLSSKDATISRLTRQVEDLKKDSEMKDSNIYNLNNAIKHEQERARLAGCSDARDKELAALRQKFKVAESKVQEQSGFIQALKADLDQAQTELRRSEQAVWDCEQRFKSRDEELMDLQRVERIARADMQEATKRYERLRNRTMQIAFSVTGADVPSGEVKDDQVVEMMKKILDERNAANEQLKVARSDLESKGSFRLEVTEAIQRWLSYLTTMKARLSEAKVPSGSLSDEITMLLTEPVHEALQPIKESLIAVLKLQLDWHCEIDAALLSCGINTKLSSERPKQHISDLNARLEAARSEADQVRARLETLTKEHQEELAKITESLTAEKDEALKAAEESADLSREEQIRSAVEEAVAAEKSKLQEQIDGDRTKTEELNMSIGQLQQSLVEKQEDYETRLKEAELNLVKIEALQATVDDLEKELAIARADAQKFAEQAEGSRVEARAMSKASRASQGVSPREAEFEAVRVELETAEKTNAELQTKVERLAAVEDEATQLRSTVGSLEVTVVDLEARVEALNAELESHLSHKTDASSRSASRLKLEVERLTREMERLQTASRSASEADTSSKAEQEVLVTELRTQISVLQSTVEAGAAALSDMESKVAAQAEELQKLQANLEEGTASKAELEAQLAELQTNARRSSSAASHRSSIGSLRAELDASLAQTRELTKEIEALREQQSSSEMQATVKELREMLRVSESAVARLVGELEIAKSSACELEEVERLRSDLQAAQAALEVAKEEPRPAEEMQAEVEGFREQVRQHSLTICSLEERLRSLVKENQDLQGQAADLKRENRILRKKKSTRTEKESDSDSRSNQVSNANININQSEKALEVALPRASIEIAAMERSLLALRQENANLKKENHEKQQIITSMKKDLSGAAARLSDIRSEMDEDQKTAVTEAEAAQARAEETLVATREQLVKLSTIIDEQQETIAALTSDIARLEEIGEKMKETISEQTKRIEVLQSESNSSQEKMKEQLEQLEEQGRITSELSATGAQCRGERHDQIISHQKEALAELRLRVKKLEQIRAPLPSHDQAVQQVVLLKKELAEMRARQALQEARVPSTTSTLPAIGGPSGSNANNLVNNSYGMNNSVKAPPNNAPTMEHIRTEIESRLDDERSAHRLTMDILEQSENTFLDLLRAVANAMELEEVGGLQSLTHLSPDERIQVQDSRVQTITKLCQRIKVLQDRLVRKEGLMSSYEQDLVRLQQAEELAKRKHQQVETLVQDVRKKTDEAQMLRESLNNTKEILSRERMLNNAIKQKKTFHMEVPKMPRGPTPQRQGPPKYHCPPPDPFNKAEIQKRRAKEREKRKDFEIETLKSKLTNREEELCRATSRLVSMETTMGLNCEEQEGT